MSGLDYPAVVDRLRAAGCVFAEDEAELLLDAPAGPDELAELLRRREFGEPLEHILGWALFDGLRIAVAPGVFVPRRRTQLLVERAASLASTGAVVVDLCCGSGAVGAALLARLGDLELHAADIEPAAVGCARRNLPGASVYQGDLFDPLPPRLRGRVQVLVANTPYVPTTDIPLMPPEARDHEPSRALDGGADGVAVQRRVVSAAPEWLASGGWLLVETSAVQASGLARVFAEGGFSGVEVIRDELVAGIVVVGRFLS